MVTRPLLSVVDDDESVRESLPDLLRELGFDARAFASAEDFLASDCVGATRCVLADVAMPGMSGLDLQRQLLSRGQPIPLVFITAHGEVMVDARLGRHARSECLLKPFSEAALLEAVQRALLES